jgi:hypothetical protein
MYLKKMEKGKIISEKEREKLISENKRKCTICLFIGSSDEFYGHNWKCKTCFKLDMKERRINDSKKQIVNQEIICNKCNQSKKLTEFRVNRKKCKDCEREHGRLYRKNETGKAKAKEWTINNKEQHAKLQAEWFQNNKKRIFKKESERTKVDPVFRLRKNCKSRIALAIKKDKSTDKYIGCTKDELMEWLNFSFKDGMTKDNYGKYWHVDHVIPVNKFSLLDNESEQNICFNWSNLSPETAEYNLSKHDSIDKKQIKRHKEKLIEFCEMKKIDIPIVYIERLDDILKKK